MPYICLARADLPNGTVQVVDLTPNSSQRSEPYDPPGQTRYVNRVQNNPVYFTAAGVTTRATDGLSALLVDLVDPGVGSWTLAIQATVSAALIARMDAGLAMAIANVNAIIQASLAASTLPAGNLTDLLACLAGRTYRLPAGAIKCPGGVWAAAQAGGFTEAYLNPSSRMVHGEWTSTTIGGDSTQREIGGIRHTYALGGFTRSIGDSNLVCFTGGSAEIASPTLWPDSDRSPHYPWSMQGALAYAQTHVTRVLVVYNDDGSLAG